MRASPGAIRPFLVSVILVIATLAFSACAQPVLPAPKASAGAMDLRGVDLERPVALDGDWEFHWKRFVDPGAFLDGTAPRALVLGMGISGMAAARLLSENGFAVDLFDSAGVDRLARAIDES
ncbi:MAG TPA: NAD(P)-binding protein, partial [Spirochaetales bacterium]|nr:NAD(P)-binding protein [Spirochaetales bacterium]